jgi:hypothetical protein
MSASLLRQLLMKDLMKESAKRTGIMTINKNLSKDVEKLLQKYISSAQSQGVDLDTLGEQQLKYIIQLNKQPVDGIPQAISADSDEGRKITEALFGKQKAPVVDMTGKTIDTSQGIMGGKSVKELMDSGQITKGTAPKQSDKVLNRDLFKNSNLNETDAQIKTRLEAGNKKSVKNIKDREMTADEIEDFEMEMGDLEPYDFDGTIGSANKIRKDATAYEKEMYQQYKMGKLDPEAGDKSPARKKFLEQKLADMEASGDSRLMTREEIEELTFFDLGTEMDKTKLSVNDEIKQGVDDVLSDTSPEGLAKSIEIDNLMLKYPGMDKNLADQIASSSPTMKADMIAMVEQTFKMDEMGMSGDDIIQTFKNTPRTKQATGGLANLLGE